MNIPIQLWVLCIVIPLITAAIVAFMILSSYKRGLDDYRMRRVDLTDIIKQKRSKVIIFTILAIVPSAYGMVLIAILAAGGNVDFHYQETVIDLVGWVLCIPVCISMIAQGSLITFFMKDYLPEKEPDLAQLQKRRYNPGHPNSNRSYPFQRSILIFTFPQTIGTFGLLVAIFLLNFSSIMDPGAIDDDGNSTVPEGGYGDGGYLIDEENIDRVKTGSWIFVGLSALSILSGFLPMMKKGSIMENKVFIWRMALGVGGTIPSMVGLLVWIIMMAL